MTKAAPTPIPSAFRLAFDKAARETPVSPTQALVKGALRRRAGINLRRTMWSVERGKR